MPAQVNEKANRKTAQKANRETAQKINVKMAATLFVPSGLPAVGKSSLARLIAQKFDATWLRIDSIEQALRDLCGFEPQGEGYRLAYRIAADNLSAGRNVVADSCNPLELTRREWIETALSNGAAAVNIEVVCSDPEEHRLRAETRKSEVKGLKLPEWTDICAREFDPWVGQHIVVDTAGKSAVKSFEDLIENLK